jgi:hypothetical protein
MEASQHSLLAACFTLHSINATLAILPQRGAGLWIFDHHNNIWRRVQNVTLIIIIIIIIIITYAERKTEKKKLRRGSTVRMADRENENEERQHIVTELTEKDTVTIRNTKALKAG